MGQSPKVDSTRRLPGYSHTIWLFFGSDDGGRRLAILSSFTETCRQFGVNPWTWLKEALTRLPITHADQLGTLLPTPAME